MDTPTATAAPETDPTLVEAEEGEERGDLVELVGTGYIRIRINDQRYRLRPPLFGEFRQLRLALEAVADEIQDRSLDLRMLADKLVDEGRKLDEDTELTPARRRTALAKLQTQNRKAGREMTALMDDLRLDWWAKVFGLLSLDGTPEEWSSSMLDASLPERVMQHWRRAPLGRG